MAGGFSAGVVCGVALTADAPVPACCTFPACCPPRLPRPSLVACSLLSNLLPAPSAMQPPLLQQVFWGTPAPGLEPGQAAAQVRAVLLCTDGSPGGLWRSIASHQACMPRL